MKISFDWDGTLTKEHIKVRFFEAINNGHEVLIITSRNEIVPDNWHWNNEELFELAHNLNIRLIFTNGADKWTYIKQEDINVHYDDDEIEIELIHENTKCSCVYVPFL